MTNDDIRTINEYAPKIVKAYIEQYHERTITPMLKRIEKRIEDLESGIIKP